MFTGIITDVTKVVGQEKTANGLRLVFERPTEWNDIELGESIATNGVCLTIEKITKDTYSCLLIPETLAVTTFGKNVPERVNLERSLKVGDRLSGHIVQGHVDCMAQVKSVSTNDGYVITVSLDKELMKYIAHKGSVTLNGVALTIASKDDTQFTVALVPHTLERTTLGELKAGDDINIEFDAIAKYAEQLVTKENS